MEDFRYVNVWRNGFNEEYSCGRRNTVVEDFRYVNVWRNGFNGAKEVGEGRRPL